MNGWIYGYLDIVVVGVIRLHVNKSLRKQGITCVRDNWHWR